MERREGRNVRRLVERDLGGNALLKVSKNREWFTYKKKTMSPPPTLCVLCISLGARQNGNKAKVEQARRKEPERLPGGRGETKNPQTYRGKRKVFMLHVKKKNKQRRVFRSALHCSHLPLLYNSARQKKKNEREMALVCARSGSCVPKPHPQPAFHLD